MKSKRKRGKPQGKSGPVQVVFKAKAVKPGTLAVTPWIEREEEKARRHLRSILAG